jgi:hypothetical protein
MNVWISDAMHADSMTDCGGCVDVGWPSDIFS